MKDLIRRAFYRWSASGLSEFIDVYPGGGAIGPRLERFDQLPELVSTAPCRTWRWPPGWFFNVTTKTTTKAQKCNKNPKNNSKLPDGADGARKKASTSASGSNGCIGLGMRVRQRTQVDRADTRVATS